MLIMKNYKDDENCRYTGTKEKIHYKFNVDINDGKGDLYNHSLQGFILVKKDGINKAKLLKSYNSSYTNELRSKGNFLYNVEVIDTKIEDRLNCKELVDEEIKYIKNILENNNILLTGFIASNKRPNNKFIFIIVTNKEIPRNISKLFYDKFYEKTKVIGRQPLYIDDEEDIFPYFKENDLGEPFKFYFSNVIFDHRILSAFRKYITYKYSDIFTLRPQDLLDIDFMEFTPAEILKILGWNGDFTNRGYIRLCLYPINLEVLKNINIAYLNKIKNDLVDFLDTIIID